MKSGQPELKRSDLTFGRFDVVHEPTSDRFRVYKGKVDTGLDAPGLGVLLRPGRRRRFSSSACQVTDDEPQGHRADLADRNPDLYLTDTIKPGRELWHTHALQLAPNPVVLVNHDPDQVIGRVLELDSRLEM